MLQFILMFLLLFIAVFLILVVLIQRGRGGGLAGAFGGMGGQSAFGTKAGDLFTKITIVLAAVWILLCIATVKVLKTSTNILQNVGQTAPALPTAGAKTPSAAGGASGPAPTATESAPAEPATVPPAASAPATPAPETPAGTPAATPATPAAPESKAP